MTSQVSFLSSDHMNSILSSTLNRYYHCIIMPCLLTPWQVNVYLVKKCSPSNYIKQLDIILIAPVFIKGLQNLSFLTTNLSFINSYWLWPFGFQIIFRVKLCSRMFLGSSSCMTQCHFLLLTPRALSLFFYRIKLFIPDQCLVQWWFVCMMMRSIIFVFSELFCSWNIRYGFAINVLTFQEGIEISVFNLKCPFRKNGYLIYRSNY